MPLPPWDIKCLVYICKSFRELYRYQNISDAGAYLFFKLDYPGLEISSICTYDTKQSYVADFFYRKSKLNFTIRCLNMLMTERKRGK